MNSRLNCEAAMTTTDEFAVLSEDDLLPLSKPEKLGLPFKRRVLGRRIVDGSFPTPTKINGRLYITRRALSEYKARLINGCP